MALPDLRVEFDPYGSPLTEFPAWQDASVYARLSDGITYSYGRQDETTSIQAGSMSVNLNNDGGIFTPGSNEVVAQWGTELKIRVPIRLRARFGGSAIPYGTGPYGAGSYSPSVAGNLLDAESASFEGGTIGGWIGGGSNPPTLSVSTLHPQDGSKGLLVTWATGGFIPLAGVTVTGLVIGRYYTFSAYVYVPTGSPDVYLSATAGGNTAGVATSTKNALTRIYVTFLADANQTDVQVWPSTSPTAGQTCYLDAAQVDEGTTTVAFTTAAPPLYDIWTGTVDSWGDAWTGGRRPVARVRASDRWARLNRKSLRPAADSEVLVDGPMGYYPLGESTDAATAGDISGNPGASALTKNQIGSGGTLVFGSVTGPTPDGGTCASFTRASAGNGLQLVGTILPTVAINSLTLEAWVNTSSAVDMGLVSYGNFSISVTSTGKLYASMYTGFGSALTVTSASNVSTGAWRHAAATMDASGGTMTINLYMDGANVGTASGSYFYTGNASLNVGGLSATFGGPYGGSIANVAIFPTALSSTRILAHYNAGASGFTGDTSDARFDRICSYASIPASLYSSPEAGLTSMGVQPLAGKSVAGALQEVADAERGLAFVNASGVTVFHSRGHRYNTVPSFTLLASDVNPDLEFTTDDQYLINDATVSRYGGGTKRVVNTDSVAQYDTYDVALSLYTDDDTFTASLAQYLVNTYGAPSPRSASVEVDLYSKNNTAPVSSMLSSTIGSRFTISALPDASSSPDTSIDLFIEGLSGTVSDKAWTWRANTSPADTSAVWQLDSATYSQLDVSTVLAF